MRYFIECGYTKASDLNTGIQRVVRNIANVSLKGKSRANIQLVQLEGENIRAFRGPLEITPASANERKRYQTSNAPMRLLIRLKRSIVKRYDKLLRLAAPDRYYGGPKILPTPGDVLILIDSGWGLDETRAISTWKQSGGTIVSVIYDLFPITNPEYYEDELRIRFERWVELIASLSDGFVCISQSVANEWRTYLSARRGSSPQLPPIAHFWLGSDLEPSTHEDSTRVRHNIQLLFDGDAPVYLYVGTIEPRKNHIFAIDAFERLWASGSNALLLIVGRSGWRKDSILQRITSHPQYGTKLVKYEDVSDAELKFIYDNANGLIFTAKGEGFGLPLVEALQHGLPVFASDIPVFREIGRELIHYVDLGNPLNLTRKLSEHLSNGAPRLAKRESWITWEESTDEFWSAVTTVTSADSGLARHSPPR